MREIGKLSNRDLIGELKRLLERDAKLEAELLLFLGEVDARRLFLQEACSSMFVYCTEILGLSEACAYHRIGAARAARRRRPRRSRRRQATRSRSPFWCGPSRPWRNIGRSGTHLQSGTRCRTPPRVRNRGRLVWQRRPEVPSRRRRESPSGAATARSAAERREAAFLAPRRSAA